MLTPVRGIVIADDACRGGNGFGDVRIDRRNAERRLESTRADDGNAVEPDEMRRTNENDDVEATVAQQTIGAGRDGTRILQARVRRDERDEIARDIARRVGEVSIDCRGQSLR